MYANAVRRLLWCAGKYREAVGILLADASSITAPENWARHTAYQRHEEHLRRRAVRALLVARTLAPTPQDASPLDEQLGLLYLDEVGFLATGILTP